MKTKRVPKYVPQQEIRWLMARVHVGTPDAEIAADIRKRVARNNAPEFKVQACIDYALRCHRENRGLYRSVMSGQF